MMLRLQSFIDRIEYIKTAVKRSFTNPWFRYGFYSLAILLSLLAAMACLAGGIALALTLGFTWPVLIAMAPLGAIFFGSVFLSFKAVGQFATLKKGLHYVMSGINSALNAAYTTSGIVKVGLALGLGLAMGPVGWIIGGCVLFSAVLGFGLGIWERKQKYNENQKLKQIAEKKQLQLQKLRQQINTKQLAFVHSLTPNNQEFVITYINAWENKQQKIFNAIIKQPVAPVKTSSFMAQLPAFGRWSGNHAITLLQYTLLLPFSDKKEQTDKLRDKWQQKMEGFSVKTSLKNTLDSAADKFNQVKNYSRNLKLVASLLPGLLLIVLGVHTLNPVLIVAGAAVAITFATMNHYRDKWEDEIFAQNSEYTKQINKVELETALVNEKQALLEQLEQVHQGEAIDFKTRTSAEQKAFMKKFYNPLAKVQHKTSLMFGLATFTAFETLAYAGIAVAAVIIGIKLAPVTAGASVLIGAGIATFFGAMAVGNLLRRSYKEIKQNTKKNELLAEYDYLKSELEQRKHIKPAVKSGRVKLHNYRSSLGSTNYTAYKAASGIKKVGKSYGLFSGIMHHGHPVIIGIGIGVVTLNPVFLAIGIIVGGALAYSNYKAEQTRIRRDKALDDLKLMNESMQIELKRLKAAEQRIRIVKQAQVEYQAKFSENTCNEQKKASVLQNGQVNISVRDKIANNEPVVRKGDKKPQENSIQLVEPASDMEPTTSQPKTVETFTTIEPSELVMESGAKIPTCSFWQPIKPNTKIQGGHEQEAIMIKRHTAQFFKPGPTIRPLAKLASAGEVAGDPERRTAAYIEVCEDSSSNEFTLVSAKVEFRKRAVTAEVLTRSHVQDKFLQPSQTHLDVKFTAPTV